jgi:hypothetical protein
VLETMRGLIIGGRTALKWFKRSKFLFSAEDDKTAKRIVCSVLRQMK